MKKTHRTKTYPNKQTNKQTNVKNKILLSGFNMQDVLTSQKQSGESEVMAMGCVSPRAGELTANPSQVSLYLCYHRGEGRGAGRRTE